MMKRGTLGAVSDLLLRGGILLARLTNGQVGTDANPSATTIVTDTSASSAVIAPSGTETQTFRPIFTVPAEANVGAPLLPNIIDPEAVDAQTVCPGYTANSVRRTPYGLTAQLSLAGEPCNVYGTDIEALNLTVQYLARDRLSVNIQPTFQNASNSSWFVVPEYLVPRPGFDDGYNEAYGNITLDNDLGFFWSNEPTFSFSVIRLCTGDVLFSTAGTNIIYEDQFVEFASSLPENYNLYGLGETIHGLRLGNNFTKTMYAADVGDPIDLNIYGSQPVYVETRYYEVDNSTGELTLFTGNETEADSDATYVSYSHGLYNRNAHGQDILLRPTNITWRAIGGSIDLYFYSGPSAEEVMTSYHRQGSGLAAMQQYWTLGFHQARWGYENWTRLQEVVDNYANYNIPLEAIWTDIDYMNQYRDFDNDEVRFGYDEGAEFLSRLHDNNQYYVPIVDAAIYVPNPENASDAYQPFTRGNDSDAFVLNPDGSLYIGSVWPGYTAFPDVFQGSGGEAWWIGEFNTYYQNVRYDGIWLDMNEASSFCIGSCGSDNLTLNPVHPWFRLPGEPGAVSFDYPEGFNLTNATDAEAAASSSASQSSANAAATPPPESTSTVYLRSTPTPGVRNLNYPPYVINNVQGELARQAIAPNASHQDGTLEYDVHNLYGHSLINATYQALLEVFPGKRPFIIARSNFVGSGMFAGHWGGDNASRWYYMYFSIAQALSFSIFGIPMFGVDTCGFAGNTDYELCSRWMQLSAFFPFYRNHNVLATIPQEAYVWSSVAEATRTAMDVRFQLLPYMYTLFEQSHSVGSNVMRALAWEFPNDPSLLNADAQFLLGPAVLVTPVLEPNVSTVSGVFPGVGRGEVYYDWYTHEAVSADPGQNVTLDAPLGHIPVHIRGGYVLPTQQMAMTTTAARCTPWSLVVALSLEGTARGSLYLDDGESIAPNATLYVDLVASNRTIYASGRGNYNDTNPLANVTVLGVDSAPETVTLNGAELDEGSASYNETSQELVISGLQNATAEGAWLSDWVLTF